MDLFQSRGASRENPALKQLSTKYTKYTITVLRIMNSDAISETLIHVLMKLGHVLNRIWSGPHFDFIIPSLVQ
jgi:hypothetical protein